MPTATAERGTHAQFPEVAPAPRVGAKRDARTRVGFREKGNSFNNIV
jgi:hypothetical protein